MNGVGGFPASWVGDGEDTGAHEGAVGSQVDFALRFVDNGGREEVAGNDGVAFNSVVESDFRHYHLRLRQHATGNEKMTKLLMGYANRPENQKKVSALKRVWKKVTKKTSDPRRTKSDSNLSQYDTEEISGLKKSESDPDVAKYEYDNVTDETSILTGSESTDSSASLYDDDEKAYLKNRRLSTDSTSTQYDNVTEKTGGLRRSESTDSNATLYENDIKTNQNIHDLNSSTDTIVAR